MGHRTETPTAHTADGQQGWVCLSVPVTPQPPPTCVLLGLAPSPPASVLSPHGGSGHLGLLQSLHPCDGVHSPPGLCAHAQASQAGPAGSAGSLLPKGTLGGRRGQPSWWPVQGRATQRRASFRWHRAARGGPSSAPAGTRLVQGRGAAWPCPHLASRQTLPGKSLSEALAANPATGLSTSLGLGDGVPRAMRGLCRAAATVTLALKSSGEPGGERRPSPGRVSELAWVSSTRVHPVCSLPAPTLPARIDRLQPGPRDTEVPQDPGGREPARGVGQGRLRDRKE